MDGPRLHAFTLGGLALIVFLQRLPLLLGVQNGMKTSVFLSPKFVMSPGSVVNRFYYDIDFPKGHIAIKSFNAEVVDEAGDPVPLHHTYLHHWTVGKYYQRGEGSDLILGRNRGICQNGSLGQYYGLGSETRNTRTLVPDPYAVVVGDPAEIPDGHEEKWMMNVHAIDTRGVVDRLGCTECRCELYNVTRREDGGSLPAGYAGGLHCCYDKTQCRLKEGFDGGRSARYMRYTVMWMDVDDSVVPVDIYILDVTDRVESGGTHRCLVEYDVDARVCGDEECVHRRRTSVSLGRGGNMVFGVAHQHSGGVGASLYGEDGRVICSSLPSYGRGTEAGNESGYIVGMSACHSSRGEDAVVIRDGEVLVVESIYNSSSRAHTGVMGLFYLLVHPVPTPTLTSVAAAAAVY